jgi:amino acid transporter
VISGLLYLLIAALAVMAAPIELLSNSSAPLADILINNGHNAEFITIISLFAIINGALVQIIMASRVLYGMSGVNTAPKIFAVVNRQTQTPILATIAVALIIWALAVSVDLVSLAKSTSFIILCIFALVNASLLVLQCRVAQKQYFQIMMATVGVTLCLGLVLMQAVF